MNVAILKKSYESCPKCGTDFWYDQESRDYVLSEHCAKVDFHDEGPRNYLRYTCNRCGFKWNIRCKDEPRKEKEI